MDSDQPTPDAPREESGPTAQAPPWLPTPPQLHIYKDAGAVAEAAAKRWLDAALRAVDKLDHFVAVLSGSQTARGVYERLTRPPYRERAPWKKTFFVFGDEGCVGPEDAASHFRLVRETLLGPLEIPDHRVLRMKGEEKPADAARRYEVRLGDLFLTRPQPGFDFALLDIGAGGETASLFPGTAALEESERWVAANHVPAIGAWRLTLTLPALNAAARAVFVGTGEDTARVVAEAFGGREHAGSHPVERVVSPGMRREVLLDRGAASLLEPQAESPAD